ncbi:MAG: hypothetical protein AW07_04635 [Candidatus Accumulibacter sp. SK-11]|nr:MAG: hypothetical protein AW07_04635 [Candidatus Accumulibacter sp. SK-11]
MHRRQPRRRDADDDDADADGEAEQQGIGDVIRQHGRCQVRPGGAGAAAEDVAQDADDGHGDQRSNREGNAEQGVEVAAGHGWVSE